MISKLYKLSVYLIFVLLTAGAAGCSQDGPMEEAGETVDEAIEDTGEAIEDAQEKIEDTVEEKQK